MIKKDVIMKELRELISELCILQHVYNQNNISGLQYASKKDGIYKNLEKLIDDVQESAVDEYKERLNPRTSVNVHNPKIVSISMDPNLLLAVDSEGIMYNGCISKDNKVVSWQRIKQDFI